MGKEKFVLGPCPHQNIRPTDNLDDDPEKLIDNSDLHVLDYAPTLKTLSILTVLEHNLEHSWLPHDILFDIRAMTLPNRISRPFNQSG